MLLKPMARCLKRWKNWRRKTAGQRQSKRLLRQDVFFVICHSCLRWNVNLYFSSPSGKISLKTSWRMLKVVCIHMLLQFRVSLVLLSAPLTFWSTLRTDGNTVTWKCTAEEGKGCGGKRFARNTGRLPRCSPNSLVTFAIISFSIHAFYLIKWSWGNLTIFQHFDFYRHLWRNLRHKQIELKSWWRRTQPQRACKPLLHLVLGFLKLYINQCHVFLCVGVSWYSSWDFVLHYDYSWFIVFLPLLVRKKFKTRDA